MSLSKSTTSVAKTIDKFELEEVLTKEAIEEFNKTKDRNVLFCKMGRQSKEYKLSILSLVIIISGIAFDIYLLIKYTSATLYSYDIDSFILQCMIVIFMVIIGILLHLTFVNRNLSIEMSGLQIILNALLGLGIMLIGLVVQTIFRGLLFSVSAFDYFMFFLSVAIGEEMLFRFGLQPTLKTFFNWNENLATILSITITALIFALYHNFVYDVKNMLIVFVVGAIFGIALETTKSIDTPLIAHIGLNIIAGMSIITEMYGGLF